MGLLRAFSVTLPRLTFLLLRHLLAQLAHTFAQRVHGFGLTINRVGYIALAQRIFGPIHGPPSLIQSLLRGVPFWRASARQIALLTLQFTAQLLLAVGQGVFG